MGFGGISIWQLVIVLGIVILLFGTKKLRNIGGDLGNAVKGFRKAMTDEEAKADAATQKADAAQPAAQLKKEDADFAAQDKPAVNEEQKKQS